MDTGTVHKSHYMTQDWHISSHLKQFTEPWLKFISKVCLGTDHGLVRALEEQIDIWDMSWHVWASAYVQFVCVYCIIACLCAHMAGYVDTKYAPSWCPNVLLHLYMVMAKSLSTSLRHGLEATFCRDFTWAVDVPRWSRHFRGFTLEGYKGRYESGHPSYSQCV